MLTLNQLRLAETQCQSYVIISETSEDNPKIRRKIEKECGEYVASLWYDENIVLIKSGLPLSEAYEYYVHWQ